MVTLLLLLLLLWLLAATGMVDQVISMASSCSWWL
jgi:hypothetical protein